MTTETKDSGVKWIGTVPADWTLLKMKHYSYMKGRIGWQGLTADEFIEEGPYLVTGTDLSVVVYVGIGAITSLKNDTMRLCQFN